MAGDGAFLIDLTLAHFWLGRLHIDYGPLSGGVRSLFAVLQLVLASLAGLSQRLLVIFVLDHTTLSRPLTIDPVSIKPGLQSSAQTSPSFCVG